MQALEQFEAVFADQKDKLTRNPDGSLAVTFETDDGINYPVTFSEEQQGWIRTNLQFFPSVPLPIQEGSELARRLDSWVHKAARISFDPQGRNFYADWYISPGTQKEVMWNEISEFIIVCNFLVPFFTQVAVTGDWDDRLIQLTFIRRTEGMSLH